MNFKTIFTLSILLLIRITSASAENSITHYALQNFDCSSPEKLLGSIETLVTLQKECDDFSLDDIAQALQSYLAHNKQSLYDIKNSDGCTTLHLACCNYDENDDNNDIVKVVIKAAGENAY